MWRCAVPGLRRRGRLAGRLLVAFAASAACVAGVASGAVADSSVGTGSSAGTGPAGLAGSAGDWPMGGHDLANSRSNPAESRIGPRTAGRLALAWSAPTGGDVSATPAVVGGAVYFPDFGGNLTKLDAHTGQLVWSRRVADYVGTPGAVSRTSPAVVGNTVYVGDQNGAHLLAVDTRTGDLRWKVQLDSHPAAVLTQSPVVRNGVVYQGVSSVEEGFAVDPAYPCCTFRGSLVAADARTGRILWKTYTVPDNGGRPGGYSGGAIWSGTPAIDPTGRTVYVTTGNNYTVPAEVDACQQAGGSAADCLAPEDHLDSVMALDTRSGRIRWVTGVQGFDTWNLTCYLGTPPNNCPDNPGPDYDFGDGAHLFTIPDGHGGFRPVVGAGQKSGVFWALDAATGQVIWSAAAGPGWLNGGIQWGSATDGRRIYIAEANSGRYPYQLPDGQTVTSGSFAALDPATGRTLWQVADPTGGIDTAAVTVANGVLFAGSITGRMFAFDAASGRLLWQFQGEGSSSAGPAVAAGTVYWGNGYARFPAGGGTPSRTFYAFSLP